jgi:hypothetical protein
VGLFDLFRGKKKEATPDTAAPAVPPEPAAPEVPPIAAVVVRQGMNLPPADYVEAVLAAQRPDLVATTVQRRGLSQPRWFQNRDAIQSGARGVAAAFAEELAVDPEQPDYEVVEGPDGAKVLFVLLYPLR